MPRAVILTALPVEYLAVRAHLTDLQEETHPQGTIYEQGVFVANGQHWEVGIAEVGAGNAGAAIEAERAIAYFKPEILLFVGIAGGIKDVAISDVVAATDVYGYEAGKAGDGQQFLIRPRVGKSAYAMIQRARVEARKGNWLQHLPGCLLSQPRVFVAPIAAGEKIITSHDLELLQFLQTNYNDALAVEMEGFGFLSAAFAYPDIKSLVIRGISNLIQDKNANDSESGTEKELQKRASQNASAFAFEVLSNLYIGSPGIPSNIFEQPMNTDLSQPGKPPAPPQIFIGRDADISALKERLGVGLPREKSQQLQVLTAMRGWPGVGKTTTATYLANDSDVKKSFPDGILWSSFGPSPDLLSELATWGRALGAEQLLRAPTLKEATSLLTQLLSSRKTLLIVDDVWETEHIFPIQQACGRSCVLLITTRSPKVVDGLSLPNKATYNLNVLTEEKAFDLLTLLAPEVTSEHPDKCRELVRDIECLPLALHVAGRLLNVESRMGWSVIELLEELRDGAKLIQAKAPADRMDLETQTIPTVAKLLSKSTELLDHDTRECFAFLGPFAPKPATFDLSALKAVWQLEDPKPVVRTLVDRGLLEPIGGRFQMHALLVQHARALLSQT
jgi:nucleoside phosphorylase